MENEVSSAPTRAGSSFRSVIDGISHDIGTPLTSITTNLFLIQNRLTRARSLPGDHDLLDGIGRLHDEVAREAERMQHALERLRSQYRFLWAGQGGLLTRQLTLDAWAAWDAALAQGQTRRQLLVDAPTTRLIDLLAADAGCERQAERRLIAAALIERLSGTNGASA
ncbi:MAG: histidine kinase dimerization/phospho-acceptor domain-containing protein [Candidatus Thermoplasmatota archaeon]